MQTDHCVCLTRPRKCMKAQIKLAEAICVFGDLSLKQFGFRAERPMVDAVMEVMDTIHRSESHYYRSRRIVVFETLVWTTSITLFSCGRDAIHQQLYGNSGEVSPGNVVRELWLMGPYYGLCSDSSCWQGD